MLKVYVKSNCVGSKKAEDFLNKNEIPYERINVSYQPVLEDDLYAMSKLSENFLDVINLNAKFFHDNPAIKDSIKNMSKKEIISLAYKNLDILSYPIAMQSDYSKTEKVLVIGFSEFEWNRFEKDPGLYNYYTNVNKSFNFKSCCFYDEVLLDDINLLVNIDKDEK